MSSEYRTKLIRRAVDANTSPNVAATPIQARTLHKFFESPQCADIGASLTSIKLEKEAFATITAMLIQFLFLGLQSTSTNLSI